MWPSIVVDESGETMIAYESNRGTISGIVIARPQPRTDRIPRCTDQIFAREFLVETPPLQTAAPILEAVEGRIWISWLAGAGRIGWCEWSGRAWGVPAYAAHSR